MKKKYLYVALIFLGLFVAIVWAVKQFFPNQAKSGHFVGKVYQQKVSNIVIPIDIDLTSFETMFNQQMEEQGYFYKEEGIEVKKNISLDFQIKKHGLAQLYPQDEKIKLVLPMLIEIYPKVKGLLSAGLSKNTQLTARVTLYADIVGSLNEDWSLHTQTVSKFTIEETPQLTILGFNVDFGDQLKHALEIGSDEINKGINEQLKQVLNTKEIVQYVWEELREPYQMHEEPFETWANIELQKIYANQLKPAGPGILNMTLNIETLFDISAGAKPQVKEKTLPNATFTTKDFGSYTMLHFPLVVNKKAFVQYLNKTYSPSTFQVQGKEFKVHNFNVLPSKHQFEMSAEFSYRGVNGKVKMSGVPKFDAKTQTMSLEQLQLISSSNKKIIDGVVNFMQKNPQLRQTIEKKLTYSLQKDLADLTFDVTKQLKETTFNEYAYLDGYLDHISINDVYVNEDDFVFDTEIKAGAVVKVGVQTNQKQ